MASGVKVKDRGLDALTRKLAKIGKGYSLTVGVHAAEGGAPHAAPEGGKAAPMTLIDVATANEYGINVPERSFIRDWADQHEARNRDSLRKVGITILRGTYDVETGFSRLGIVFQGEIQARIVAGIAPENAESTIKKKGSSTPLVNTGQLKASILWKVTKE